MQRVILTLVAVVTLARALAVPASGHPMSPSAVLLDMRRDHVEGEVQLPIDRLAVAVDRPLSARSVLGADRSFLVRYAEQHIAAVGDGGATWDVMLGTASVQRIDGADHLVLPLKLLPPDGQVTNFDLRYDVIVEQLRTHKVIATVRSDFGRGVVRTDDAETLGVFHFATTRLQVPAGEGSWLRGFATTTRLGIEHAGEGSDHLLFLLMLLIPAPLAAAGPVQQTAIERTPLAVLAAREVADHDVGGSSGSPPRDVRCANPAATNPSARTSRTPSLPRRPWHASHSR